MQTGTNRGAITSGENISYWIESLQPLEFRQLQQDAETDVLVVGGGLAGVTTAYCLLSAGKKVILVEDGRIGSGESGRTTAHLTYALDDRYYSIEKTFGPEGLKLAADSHRAAIDWIEKTVAAENSACSFERVDGFLFLHPSDKRKNLEDELEATHKAGLPTQWVEELHGLTGVRSPAIRFPAQAQFHIMRYLETLCAAIQKMGGLIYTGTRAVSINSRGATCNGFSVKASHIVVATNTPVNDLVTMHTKQFAYRTYVVGMKVPKGQLPHCLWWDTGDQASKWPAAPYHYVRLQSLDNEHDLLIAGGEDHKTGQADDEGVREEDRYDRLEEWTRQRFPQAGEVVYRWSGQVMEPIDYMGFIGKNPGDDNIYIITGDSGNGMTHATLGGIIVTDLIVGKENPWAGLYSPKRIPLKMPGEYFSEMLNMAKQYADYVRSADISDPGQLANGEGAILGKGLHKFAVYKDPDGKTHIFSAVCPHLGCIVQWNGDEKTFDCPCHGSRFSKEGEVINGPALEGLQIKSLH